MSNDPNAFSSNLQQYITKSLNSKNEGQSAYRTIKKFESLQEKIPKMIHDIKEKIVVHTLTKYGYVWKGTSKSTPYLDYYEKYTFSYKTHPTQSHSFLDIDISIKQRLPKFGGDWYVQIYHNKSYESDASGSSYNTYSVSSLADITTLLDSTIWFFATTNTSNSPTYNFPLHVVDFLIEKLQDIRDNIFLGLEGDTKLNRFKLECQRKGEFEVWKETRKIALET